MEDRDERFFHRQTDAVEVRGMLRLRVDAHRGKIESTGSHDVDRSDQVNHFLQRGDLEAPVEARGSELWQALARAKRLELGEREVLSKPAVHRHAVDHLRRLSGGELRMAGDVGG